MKTIQFCEIYKKYGNQSVSIIASFTYRFFCLCIKMRRCTNKYYVGTPRRRRYRLRGDPSSNALFLPIVSPASYNYSLPK